jgi:hypothetical protein
MGATGRTLLQRVVSDDTLARVFGVLESLAMIALAIGSVLVPVLEGWLGLRGTVVAFGCLLPGLALLTGRSLRRVEATVVVPEREIALLSRVAIFSPLPAPALESLARRATWLLADAGTALMREGDHGDRYFVLSSGGLEITREGRAVGTLVDPGDAVGEIALLFDRPRTATVVATEPSELLAIDREDFLLAVTGHGDAARVGHAVATERLPDADPQTAAPGSP